MSKPYEREDNIILPDVWKRPATDSNHAPDPAVTEKSSEELAQEAEAQERRLRREAFFGKYAAATLVDVNGKPLRDEDGEELKQTPEQVIARLTTLGIYPKVPTLKELRDLRRMNPGRVWRPGSTIYALVNNSDGNLPLEANESKPDDTPSKETP